MAFQLPKINLADAKTRIILIVSGVVGFVGVVYVAVHFFSSKTTTTGASHVASAPGGLKSVPGGELTPEYYRALVKANAQAAKQAQISGGSAVPTLLNEPGAEPAFQQPSTPSCTMVCPTEENANVENDVNALVKAGKLSAKDGKSLVALAKKNVGVSEYAAYLDSQVKQGKLSPEEARQLLDSYKKQHENNLLRESGGVMDSLIQSGQLPIDAANELLDLQKKHVSPAEYAAKLNELVRQGKISPETAKQLLDQYTQQSAKAAAAEARGQLAQMAVAGQIKPDVAKELASYQTRQVPLQEYKEELQHLVKQGRLTPEQAARFLDQYQKSKVEAVPQGVMGDMVAQAAKNNADAINQLVKAGKISPEVGKKLLQLQQADVPVDEYKRQLQELVRQGKISPEEAQRLLQDYEKQHAMRREAARLDNLQANHASVSQYADELKNAVADGVLTPDLAAALLKEYQALRTQAAAPAVAALPQGIKSDEAFAALQRKIQQQAPKVAPPAPAVTQTQFGAVASKSRAEAAQEEQQRLEAMVRSMSSQAGQLISAWQPPKMSGQMGNPETKSKTKQEEKTTASSSTEGKAAGSEGESQMAPLIKAGTIVYAVLDTAVNSDFPDSPVLATLVQGKFKGAKLLGKLAITKDKDRVGLTFKLMNMEDWTKGKTINAYAIDPDTARTALASNVNYHYFVRYGGLLASSFLQGYASAITNSGATTSSGIFGTTTTHAVFSPADKFMTGLGQVGQSLGQVVSGYTSIPPTVKIDPGVSLGILFMQDVAG